MVASKKIYDHSLDETTNSNSGHSLLSFMNLASNKVKTALEKPNTFKRNINHRRFLQKQFRAMVKNPEKNPGRRSSIVRENIDSMNFSIHDCNGPSFPPPLSHNFVQFDALDASIPNLAFESANYYTPYPRSDDYGQEQTLHQRQMQCNAFERGGNVAKQSSCVYQNDSSLSVPELIVEEDFLTGEELTQAIELKDLFIPETDLTQYLLSGKENLGGFCNSDASFDNCLSRGLQEDILVF